MNFSEVYEDSVSLVSKAVQLGHADILKQLLEQDKDYCVHDNRGWYPIHEAAWHGHVKCVQLLLHAAALNGDDPLEIWPLPYDPNDGSPLAMAASRNHENVVKVLLPIYGKDEPGSILLKAVAFPHILLLLLKSHLFDINYKCELVFSDCEETALHRAVHCANVDSFKLLLAWGADKLACDGFGRAPLHLVALAENPEVMDEILCELLKTECSVNARDESDCTPLFLASQLGRFQLVKCLLEHGGDPHIPLLTDLDNNKVRVCPICVAAQNGDLQLLELLITHTSKSRLCEIGGISPVVMAVVMKQPEALNLLLKYGYTADGLLPLCNVSELPGCFTYGDEMLSNILSWDFSEITMKAAQVVRTLLENQVPISALLMKNDYLVKLVQSNSVGSYHMLKALLIYGLIEKKYPEMPEIDNLSSLLGGIMADVVENPYKFTKSKLVLFTDFIPNVALHFVDLLPVLTKQFSLVQLCRWNIRQYFLRQTIPLKEMGQLNLPDFLKKKLFCSSQSV